jgi:hypothetical protein
MTSGGTSPEQAQQQVLDRAGTDPAFRARLLENPNAAVGEHMGSPLPAGITIRVIEEQPGEVVLVLPAQSTASGASLSEDELERAAGGNTAQTIACSTCGSECFY